MKLKLKCTLATVMVFILIISIVGVALAKEVHSKPVNLRSRIVKTDDNNTGDPEGDLEGDPKDDPEDVPEDDPEGDPKDDLNDDLENDPEDGPEDDLEDDPEDDLEDDPEGNPEDDPEDDPESDSESDSEEQTEPGNPDEGDPTNREPVPARVVAGFEDGQVNVRETAGNDGAVIGQLASGAPVMLLGYEGNWAMIKTGDLQGFVHRRFIDTEFVTEPTDPVDEGEGEDLGEDLEEEFSESDVPLGVLQSDLNDSFVRIWMENAGEHKLGDIVTLHSQVENFYGWDYTMQWQCKDGNGNLMDIAGATGMSYSFELTEANKDCEWRVILVVDAPVVEEGVTV